MSFWAELGRFDDWWVTKLWILRIRANLESESQGRKNLGKVRRKV